MTALTGIGNGGQPGQNRQILTPGLTQITGFGSIYYAFGMLVAPTGDTLGLSQPQAYVALSAGLLASPLVAPLTGRPVDGHGARAVMALAAVPLIPWRATA